MTNINTKLKVTHNRTYLDVKIGDNVKIYQQMFDEGHKSKWSNETFKITGYESVIVSYYLLELLEQRDY